MPTVTIDNRAIDVPRGTTVLQAGEKLGIFIPHYCYHPGLSIAGSCRMCLVEIEKAPKLQIACYTMVSDGMVVHTTSEKVVLARQAILEFLLSNHPLDCPVCDQAGECKLQEYYMSYGRYDSTVLEDKHKKHKALPIGPHIMLDSERCILCSRCVRFVNEITHTHELGIFERGSRSELLPVNGTAVANSYSGCLADICPVGALTDRDFRFKVRVWYLDKIPSVCHGCARGCSITIHVNKRRAHHNDGRLIARFKPRFNPEVNGHWICDAGRYSYGRIEADNRLRQPTTRMPDGSVSPLNWPAAFAAVAGDLANRTGAAGVIATPMLSNEELWAVRRLFADGLKIGTPVWKCPPDPRGIDDDLLQRADTFANSHGAQAVLGDPESAATVEGLLSRAGAGELKALIVIGDGLLLRFDEAFLRDKLSRVECLIAIQSHRSVITELAVFALPMATYAETDGSVCNFEGHIQRFWAAIPLQGEARGLTEILAEIGAGCGVTTAPRNAAACFAELARSVAQFGGQSYEAMGELGIRAGRGEAVPVGG